MSKQSLVLTLISLLLFVFGFCYANEPKWLYTLKHLDNELIGYGVHEDFSIAKKKALSDISETINVNIKSDLQLKEHVLNNEVSNDTYINIDTKSEANLHGTKVVKSEQIGTLWYVAVLYNKDIIEVKMKKALAGMKLTDEKQNKFLTDSALFNRLNKELYFKLDYKVIRHDGLWYIKYKNVLIALNDKDFIDLFSFHNGANLSFKANKKVYYPDEKMHFDIEFKKPGYLSVLYVESNGKVGILLDNQKHSKSMRYPEIKSEEEFIIANPYKKTLTEMYIAIHSKEKMSLKEFEVIDNSYLDDSNYKFAILADKLNTTDFASSIIKIRY